MRRIGLLLIPWLLFLAACGSGGASVIEQPGAEEPGQEEAVPTQTEPTTTSDGLESAEEPAADDPTQPRDRDWKLGNTVDPAVTVIEYGDFQ